MSVMLEERARQLTDSLLRQGGMRGRLEGFRNGYMRGFEEGFRHACREVARNMLMEGQEEAYVGAVTGLDLETVSALATEVDGAASLSLHRPAKAS